MTRRTRSKAALAAESGELERLAAATKELPPEQAAAVLDVAAPPLTFDERRRPELQRLRQLWDERDALRQRVYSARLAERVDLLPDLDRRLELADTALHAERLRLGR